MGKIRHVPGNNEKCPGVGQNRKTEMIFKIVNDWYNINIGWCIIACFSHCLPLLSSLPSHQPTSRLCISPGSRAQKAWETPVSSLPSCCSLPTSDQMEHSLPVFILWNVKQMIFSVGIWNSFKTDSKTLTRFGMAVGHCFPNFNARVNALKILLRYQCWFNRSGVGPEILLL